MHQRRDWSTLIHSQLLVMQMLRLQFLLVRVKSKMGSHPLSSLEFSRPWSKQHLVQLHIDESEETFIYVIHSLQPVAL